MLGSMLDSGKQRFDEVGRLDDIHCSLGHAIGRIAQRREWRYRADSFCKDQGSVHRWRANDLQVC